MKGFVELSRLNGGGPILFNLRTVERVSQATDVEDGQLVTHVQTTCDFSGVFVQESYRIVLDLIRRASRPWWRFW